MNSLLAYSLALPIQSLVVRWDTRGWDCSAPENGTQKRPPSKIFRLSANSCDSEFAESSGPDSQSSSSDERAIEERHTSAEDITRTRCSGNRQASWPVSVCLWALGNPLLLVFWLLTFTVGLPLRCTLGNDNVLGICLLFSVWLSALAIQGSIKTNSRLRPWLRTLLFGIFNAVLWTSLVMIGYAFADAAISNRPVHDILGDLQTGKPFSRRLANLDTDKSSLPVAAGDVAQSVLNAGLVAWGLKLYEYRRQLLSRAGLTVFLVSSLLALGNIVLGPLFAHLVGLRPAKSALAFAARSVTIALASPVMAVLKGDEGLNAAMVVMSGILYQMGLGFGAGAWLERRLAWNSQHQPRPSESSPGITGAKAAPGTNESKGTAVANTVVGTGRRDLESQTNETHQQQHCTHDTIRRNVHDPRTVAAGVTVGINSAAMGTAYLYGAKSDAAPYSALSMIALGIMTVGFSTIKPLVAWIIEQVTTTP